MSYCDIISQWEDKTLSKVYEVKGEGDAKPLTSLIKIMLRGIVTNTDKPIKDIEICCEKQESGNYNLQICCKH